MVLLTLPADHHLKLLSHVTPGPNCYGLVAHPVATVTPYDTERYSKYGILFSAANLKAVCVARGGGLRGLLKDLYVCIESL